MEVDAKSFYPLLLDILTDISESHFVAVDLELSGVPSKQAGSTTGRQSLQQRYLEIKEAAERYQILQIGITCVHQDVENQRYVLRPYNFDLSPVIQERGIDIERIFSYQSGACEFLLKVGFDMARPFTHGVPYLSRVESREAREKFKNRQNKNAFSDIQIKPTDTEALALLDRIRTEIDAWLKANNSDYYNIDSVGPRARDEDAEAEAPEELSRFEKRLIHQVIRAEYPQLVTMGKRGFVQVVHLDQEREDRFAAERKREFDGRVDKQKGFRWIIEALLGGSTIGDIDVRECARNPVTGDPIFADLDDLRARLHRACTRIRRNPRMIVGHNCFLDMVYIYRTFIGPLPDAVEEFSEKLHKHWPLVVDTKYMSTHNCGDINPASSLEQVAQQLSYERLPKIEVDELHQKYNGKEVAHEAGYDSLLTASVAVKLSAKLEREGHYISEMPTCPISDGSNKGKSTTKEHLASGLSALNITKATKAVSNVLGLSKPEDDSTTLSSLDTASNAESNSGFTPSVEGLRWKRTGDPSLGPHAEGDEYSPGAVKHHFKVDPDAAGVVEGGMPRIKSDFWRIYGNKMRVFGTLEGICMLSEEGQGAVSSDEDGDGGVRVEVK